MASARPEDLLQYHAAQWLRANGILFFHPPNGGKRSLAAGARLVALGMVSGVHDLIILLPPPDGPLFVELKTDKGKLSPAQLLWHEAITKTGYQSHTLAPADWSALLLALEGLIPPRYIRQCAKTYHLLQQSRR